MKLPLEDFLGTLSETNTKLEDFVDFQKVERNMEKVSIALNQLNYLLGKENLFEAISLLFKENPSAFSPSVLGILIAVRDGAKKVVDDEMNVLSLRGMWSDPRGIFHFFERTGLVVVFKDKKISNLVDYVFGVEVGLDSNARKNRGGSTTEDYVARAFTGAGISYRKQVDSSEFPEIESALGADLKCFDFVIKTKKKTYLIEVNYYNGGGSKLNETARSYSELAPKVNAHSKFEFIWITDGKGWFSAKTKFEEAYKVIPSVFNFSTLPVFINKVKEEL